jgi:hypothetical protein
MKWNIILILVILSLFLFGCSQIQTKSCGYDTNQMIDVTGQIIDTHHVVDKKSNPPFEWTIVTIRTANCDVFALKESVEYERTKSEDTMLRVDKTCIPQSSGNVSFKGLYRVYSAGGFSYDLTPSLCEKTSENVNVNATE